MLHLPRKTSQRACVTLCYPSLIQDQPVINTAGLSRHTPRMIVSNSATYRLALTTVKHSMKFRVSSNRLLGRWLLCRLHWATKSHSLLGSCQGSTKTCFSVALGAGPGRWSSRPQSGHTRFLVPLRPPRAGAFTPNYSLHRGCSASTPFLRGRN